jgi:hypothetical protein
MSSYKKKKGTGKAGREPRRLSEQYLEVLPMPGAIHEAESLEFKGWDPEPVVRSVLTYGAHEDPII